MSDARAHQEDSALLILSIMKFLFGNTTPFLISRRLILQSPGDMVFRLEEHVAVSLYGFVFHGLSVVHVSAFFPILSVLLRQKRGALVKMR